MSVRQILFEPLAYINLMPGRRLIILPCLEKKCILTNVPAEAPFVFETYGMKHTVFH